MPAAFDCPFCKQTFSGADRVRRIVSCAPLSGLHPCACPQCATSIECRVRRGEIDVGYTDWAEACDELLPWWSRPPA